MLNILVKKVSPKIQFGSPYLIAYRVLSPLLHSFEITIFWAHTLRDLKRVSFNSTAAAVAATTVPLLAGWLLTERSRNNNGTRLGWNTFMDMAIINLLLFYWMTGLTGVHSGGSRGSGGGGVYYSQGRQAGRRQQQEQTTTTSRKGE